MMRPSIRGVPAVAAALAALLAACEPGHKEVVQVGFRGTGMQVVYDQDVLDQRVANTHLPDPIPPTPAGAPTAPGNWQNVQVLRDVSLPEFNRTRVAMTQWVSPQQGCAYCHAAGNFASDSLYTKVVARQMLRMVRNINGNWTAHVAQTGVTCWTCHRGQPVPNQVWYLGRPDQPLRHYLDRQDVRVQSASWQPSNANRSSVKQTEYTYALMISMSRSLGVNCVFCHNSPRWSSWEQSTPQRLTALRGIRMTRQLNNDYLLPLTGTFPAQRLGPMGDVAKIQCATCHQGAYKPLYGARIAENYPALYQHATPVTVPTDSTPVPADSMAPSTGPTSPQSATVPIPNPAPPSN